MCPLLFSFPSREERKSDPRGLGLHPQGGASLLSRELQLGQLRFQLSVAPLPFSEELKHWEGFFSLGNLHFLMQREQENIYGQRLSEPTAQGGDLL